LNYTLIKKVGYGYLKLKPNELWELSACEFADMYFAYSEVLNEDFDINMQRTSWFTALLMNASGNFKKHIKPDKLYEPLEARKKKENKAFQKSYVDEQREVLKKKFNIE
jgi:hypothetical protein